MLHVSEGGVVALVLVVLAVSATRRSTQHPPAGFPGREKCSAMNGQQKRGRGRPSKGPRCLVKGEVPVSIAERFRRDAEERKLSQADTLAAILAAYYGEGEAMQQAS